MAEFMDFVQIESDDTESICRLCAEQGKDATAKKICQECKEKFCENCSLYHISQTYANTHKLLKIKEQNALPEIINKSKGECEPCITHDNKADAVRFSKECKELLCETCSSVQSSPKLTNWHENTDVEQMEPAVTVSCEPCKENSLAIQAVKCCISCKEALCKTCVIAHKSQKATKSHELVDISEFFAEVMSEKLCEPCIENGKNKAASQFCIECQELLCDECATVHKALKATKHHLLIDSVKIPTTLCRPCLKKGENVPANKKCKECEEALCVSCTKQHKAQKATKNHNLEELTISVVDIKLCDPCAEGTNEEIATKYCELCDEFYCDKCSEMHIVMKATRTHTLVEAKTALTSISVKIQVNVKDALGEVSKPQKNDVKNGRPGKPIASDHTFDSITLHWETPNEFKESSYFQIRYKERGEKWLYYAENPDSAKIRICNLKANTVYCFQVRVITDNQEGPYSPESDEVCTTAEPIKKITPGKPVASDQKSDSISLHWEPPTNFNESSIYQIRYKEKGKKWQFYHETSDIAYIIICNLQAETTYIFQVRVITDDEEGHYSPESDKIHTKASLASRLLPYCSKIEDGPPAVYQLHSTEIKSARNELLKTRKFELGSPPLKEQKEKTILLVGATGSGKSTLVDGIINYVTGVNWKDPYRFTLVDLEKEEKNKNQACSQTEWITCYSINQEEGSRLNYRLKIIDTPGFGDTRGLDRDNEIIRQLKELFSAPGEKGVIFIDAVCFLIKAPDARLTAIQKYIFMSIQSLFGKDIKENICILITFADGKNPPVLAAMKEAELPFADWFVFNNSGLFAENDDSHSSLAPMFWEMGNKSFKKFFDSLDKMPTKSLQQTKQVLQERERLEITIQKLQPEVDAGLNKVSELKQEIDIISKHEQDILDNKNFEYEVEETRQVKTELPKGQHTTNCQNCHVTCHANCAYANDDEKEKCCAMRNGICTVCDQKCSWKQHANTPYIFSFETHTVKKTYDEMLKLYKRAGEQKVSHEEIMKRMMTDLEILDDSIQGMMAQVNDCNNTLKNIALRPNPLTIVEYLDLMIQSEKMEKKEGFQKRIGILEKYRKKAQIDKDVSKFQGALKTTIGSRVTQSKAVGRQPNTFWKQVKALFPQLY